MDNQPELRIYDVPPEIPRCDDFDLTARCGAGAWRPITTVAVKVSKANRTGNIFQRNVVSLASVDMRGPVTFRAEYKIAPVQSAAIRPLSLGLKPDSIEGNTITFTLTKPVDLMLQINDSKWLALHFLANPIPSDTPIPPPAKETDEHEEETQQQKTNIWHFGPGLNACSPSISSLVTPDADLPVPANTTVVLSPGAFVTYRMCFVGVSRSSVVGPGAFLFPPQRRGDSSDNSHLTGRPRPREVAGGAVYMADSTDITIRGVTAVDPDGFSLVAGQCARVRVEGYRVFSHAGNGDGVDFFCCRDVSVTDCFLRTSDDCVAVYGARWGWYGDTEGVTVERCVFLPDIAHAVSCGLHGNFEEGVAGGNETMRGLTVRDCQVLDHEENQLWYQGVLALNAGDGNLLEDVLWERVTVERITRGQLFNLRVVSNPMYSTVPGRGIRGVTVRDLTLLHDDKEPGCVVNPSQIMGYDGDRAVENVRFENLRVGGEVVHAGMAKPRWYMVEDYVPVFVNEHVKGLEFVRVP